MELINPGLANKEYAAMASLFEALNNAHDGEAVTLLGREFELTPKQTEAAVTTLLPAISAVPKAIDCDLQFFNFAVIARPGTSPLYAPQRR